MLFAVLKKLRRLTNLDKIRVMKLISVGETTIDYYPAIEQTFVGGISLNFAVQARRCGAEAVALVSAIGQDANGKLILDRLKQEQIDTSHIAVLPGKTAHCEIVVLENGDRYFPPNSYHQHVLADFAPDAAALAFIQQHDVVVSRFDISYSKTTFSTVMGDLPFDGKRVADFGDWFDYEGRHDELFPWLDRIDLAFISGDKETVSVFQDAIMGKVRPKKAQVIITLGDQGSVALVDGGVIQQPAIPVERIVDATGCGDAFQAAFTVEWMRSSDLVKALQSGAENASKTLQHYGAS